MAAKPRDHDYLFKLVIIGDSAVGKSNLLLRYAASATLCIGALLAVSPRSDARPHAAGIPAAP